MRRGVRLVSKVIITQPNAAFFFKKFYKMVAQKFSAVVLYSCTHCTQSMNSINELNQLLDVLLF